MRIIAPFAPLAAPACLALALTLSACGGGETEVEEYQDSDEAVYEELRDKRYLECLNRGGDFSSGYEGEFECIGADPALAPAPVLTPVPSSTAPVPTPTRSP